MVLSVEPSSLREPSSQKEPSSAKKSSNPSEPSRLSGLLGRYATKRVTRFFVIIGAIWSGVSLLALSLWNRNPWDDTPGSYFWLDVAVVLVCDTLLAGLLISGCKSLLRLKSAGPFYSGPRVAAAIVCRCHSRSVCFIAQLDFLRQSYWLSNARLRRFHASRLFFHLPLLVF
jgi:hypothetical protein